MASTTIRVSSETRDQLNALCAQSGRTADAVISDLVASAREQALLEAASTHWHAMVSDGRLMASYRQASVELGSFDSDLPDY